MHLGGGLSNPPNTSVKTVLEAYPHGLSRRSQGKDCAGAQRLGNSGPEGPRQGVDGRGVRWGRWRRRLRSKLCSAIASPGIRSIAASRPAPAVRGPASSASGWVATSCASAEERRRCEGGAGARRRKRAGAHRTATRSDLVGGCRTTATSFPRVPSEAGAWPGTAQRSVRSPSRMRSDRYGSMREGSPRSPATPRFVRQHTQEKDARHDEALRRSRRGRRTRTPLSGPPDRRSGESQCAPPAFVGRWSPRP